MESVRGKYKPKPINEKKLKQFLSKQEGEKRRADKQGV